MLTLLILQPDLKRCSKIIAGASALTWNEYRHQKCDFLRRLFFCSAHQLHAFDFTSCMKTEDTVSRTPRPRSPAPSSCDDGTCGGVVRLTSLRRTSYAANRTGGYSHECCECTHQSLSETITLAHTNRSNGRRKFSACMVSGMHSVSYSAHSP